MKICKNIWVDILSKNDFNLNMVYFDYIDLEEKQVKYKISGKSNNDKEIRSLLDLVENLDFEKSLNTCDLYKKTILDIQYLIKKKYNLKDEVLKLAYQDVNVVDNEYAKIYLVNMVILYSNEYLKDFYVNAYNNNKASTEIIEYLRFDNNFGDSDIYIIEKLYELNLYTFSILKFYNLSKLSKEDKVNIVKYIDFNVDLFLLDKENKLSSYLEKEVSEYLDSIFGLSLYCDEEDLIKTITKTIEKSLTKCITSNIGFLNSRDLNLAMIEKMYY